MPLLLVLTELPDLSRSVHGVLQEAMDSFCVESSSGARGVWDLCPFPMLGTVGEADPPAVCQAGNVGCNLGKNIDIAVIHPVSTAGIGEPPVMIQAQKNVLGSKVITWHPLMRKSNLVPQKCLLQVA